MTLNKNTLAIAVAGALLFAANANAQVVISATTPVPVVVAQEANLNATSGSVITNGGALNLTSRLGYAFSNGEVRYARFECSSNVRFEAATAAYTDGGGAAGTVALGAVNGVGTSAISFSVTATAAGVGDNALDVFTIDGSRRLMSQGAATCTYSLYDQPSQAQAGGATGRIATYTGAYINFASSYQYTTTSNSTTANVEANPSFVSFVSAAPTNSTARAQLGAFAFGLKASVPLDLDGAVITLADILAGGTKHVITGDFTAAANTNGTYTGAALNRVFLSSNADCSTVDTAATAVTATDATFTTGAAAITAQYACYTPNGTTAIPASTYSVSMTPVSNTGYTGGSLGPNTLGPIVRNGTELQAPLAQVPAGFISRMALTNTGSTARPYTISVISETGTTIGTANLTGTIPATGTTVLNLADVMTSFTTGKAPRGTINVTVAGPTGQIQGLYQIVSQSTGAISNHVMVRPGSN